jgi:tRNA pseudouridine38-40 synthase
MFRYKLIVEYCGTKYHGMQKQTSLPTIQNEVEKALQKYCGQDKISYCGRTDVGVHAIGQVAHFDTTHDRSNISVVRGINFYLNNNQISILNAEKVDINFHSRFSTKKRYYIYKILNRNSKLTFMQDTHLHCYHKINIEAMQQGANYLVGQHDFTSFRGSGCTAISPIKTIDFIKISKISHINGDEIIIEICAKSFLYNMVRNIVGSLLEVGIEKKQPEWIQNILISKNRLLAAKTAPAHGLYFYKAEY